MAGSAAELVTLLELEQLEVDLFRGAQARTERQRVFGGQVAAQAVVAATRSVEGEFVLHSLHSYFLRPGDTTVPIVYDVERIRDGRSFATRRVSARQHGRPIYFMTADFQIPEPGLEHQDAMPEVAGPEQGMPLVELARERGPEAAEHWEREWSALDIRHVGVSGRGIPDDPERLARARLWIKVDGELAGDATTQTAAFTYASDLTLLGAALVPHGIHIASPRLQPASLDHTIWFHRPFRVDDWWLYDQFSPFAGGGRGPRARPGLLPHGRAGRDRGAGGADPGPRPAVLAASTMVCRSTRTSPRQLTRGSAGSSTSHGGQASDQAECVRPSRCGEPSFGLVSAKVQPSSSWRAAKATVPGRKTGFLKATSTVTAAGSRFSIAAMERAFVHIP